jgi:hypothetical protein
MVIAVISVAVLGAIALMICCVGFGREANKCRRCSSVTFLGFTGAEPLKLRLVKRIQQKRKITADLQTTVILHSGTTAPRLRISAK